MFEMELVQNHENFINTEGPYVINIRPPVVGSPPDTEGTQNDVNDRQNRRPELSILSIHTRDAQVRGF